jgi:WD40 repeat protein
VLCAAFSPDSRQAATGGSDAAIRLWEVSTGKEAGCIEEHHKGVSGLQFSSDGDRLVSCDEGGRIMVHLAETGWEIRPPLDQKDWLTCLALSPDDRVVVCGGKSSLVVWDLKSGERLYTLPGHETGVMAVAFTRDGRLISAGLDHLRLWDVGQGKLIHTFQGQGSGITSLAVSPTGRHVATGGFERTIRLWTLPDVS